MFLLLDTLHLKACVDDGTLLGVDDGTSEGTDDGLLLGSIDGKDDGDAVGILYSST